MNAIFITESAHINIICSASISTYDLSVGTHSWRYQEWQSIINKFYTGYVISTVLPFRKKKLSAMQSFLHLMISASSITDDTFIPAEQQWFLAKHRKEQNIIIIQRKEEQNYTHQNDGYAQHHFKAEHFKIQQSKVFDNWKCHKNIYIGKRLNKTCRSSIPIPNPFMFSLSKQSPDVHMREVDIFERTRILFWTLITYLDN